MTSAYKHVKTPWVHPTDAPPIEQSVHDFIVSAFRRQTDFRRNVEIIPISPGAEAKRGWDAAILEAVPLYLQYKLPNFSSRPHEHHKVASAVRKQWHFHDVDGLFNFRLRKQAEHEPRSQHELLVELADMGHRVYYVAPTFVDFKRLRRGADLLHNEAYLDGRISIQHRNHLEQVYAPIFRDLICIPPHCNVNGLPERHRFYYNFEHEVSLHSDPTMVPSLNFQDVYFDQLETIQGEDTVTSENVEEYSIRVLKSLVGGRHANEADFEQTSLYFESHRRALLEARGTNNLMASLRALSQTVWVMTGVQVLLTVKKRW
ncbi:hypothetical protein [Comamonas kerstersii]|uniref:hypothetical protein n=1 Tax=Comamonas kerstersii TaxID=225992 RepID=UPI00266B4852|nr:hypothetical protein [Comamonas kerstersii]